MLVLSRPRVRQARSRHGGHAHRPDRHPELTLHPPSRRTLAGTQSPRGQSTTASTRDGRLRGSGAGPRTSTAGRTPVRRRIPLPRPGPPPHLTRNNKQQRAPRQHEEEDEWDALLSWFGWAAAATTRGTLCPRPNARGFPDSEPGRDNVVPVRPPGLLAGPRAAGRPPRPRRLAPPAGPPDPPPPPPGADPFARLPRRTQGRARRSAVGRGVSGDRLRPRVIGRVGRPGLRQR